MYKLSVEAVPCTPSWNLIVSRGGVEEEVPGEELEGAEPEEGVPDAPAAGEEAPAVLGAPPAGLLPSFVDGGDGGDAVGATWITHFLISLLRRASRVWASVLSSIKSRPAWACRICVSMAT